MTATEDFGCRARVHESPTHGRVLEIVLAASQSPDSWKHVREVLEEEVDRQHPQSLVIDLRALGSLYGAPLTGALVVGAAAMQKLGPDRRTRIVATAQIARALERVIRMAKVDALFGGRIYPDSESALRGQDRVQ